MPTALSIALALSCATLLFLWLFISLLGAVYSSSFKEIITFKFVGAWSSELKETFDFKTAMIMVALVTLLFWGMTRDTMQKLDQEKRGQCTCRCKACEKIQARVEFLEDRLGICLLDDEEDEKIEDCCNCKVDPEDLKEK